MANSAKLPKPSAVGETQLQLLYGEDALTKYWNSSLFNNVYLRHDISDKHPCWKDDEDLDFQSFMNELRNIAADYKNREKELAGWSETETINNWVKRILGALGWENNCTGKLNPYLEETSFRYDNKTYRTDILIVDLPNEKMYVKDAEGNERIQVARDSVLMPVEVKYWQRLEEYRQGKKEEKNRADNGADDIARTTTPNEQTVQYMDILKKSWGILTDGARWRLFNSQLSSEDAERYYEFNFSSLFQAITTEESQADSLEVIGAAKYFYHFFSKSAFYPKNEGERPFVDEVLQYSKKYVNKVEEDLKDRFVKAMNIACNGFFNAAKAMGHEQDINVIRNVSESALFNILFIKSLESRSVLPMASTDYKKISLSSMIDKIERFDPKKEDLLNTRELERAFKKGNGNSFIYKPDGTELHDRILRLTGVIHKGASRKDDFGFEISGFKESIFSNEEWKMFERCKISNNDWVKILFELGYAESESLNRRYQQIPYSYFTPRQLGSIYESFLEFKIDKSTDDMVFEKKRWKSADLKSLKYRLADIPKVSKGQLFFTPDNEDRKATGSYYTPDHIVQFIVRQTLEPLIKNRQSQDILELKVCDPAMGSGHFLSGALRYLSWAYLNESENSEEILLSDVKAKILKKCIFGSDINPRAVKLAKLSLWLETATTNKKLEELGSQLKCTNSLTDFDLWKNQWGFLDNGIDAVLGNPPYLGEKGNRHIFEDVKTSKLSISEVYQRHMDFFYFFIALGVDLLKEDARLGFITTGYWMNAESSKNLKSFIQKRGSIDLIVDFGEQVIFEDAPGQHNICFFIQRGLQKTQFDQKKGIIDGSNLRLEEMHGPEGALKSNADRKSLIRLSDVFEIKQGLVTGADRISRKNLGRLGPSFSKTVPLGTGIFVLTKKEIAMLRLNASESKIIKPLYTAMHITDDGIDKNTDKFLILSNLIKSLDDVPNLKAHFLKFEKILKTRPQMEHCRDWWDLHQIRLKDKNKTGNVKDYFYEKPKLVYISLSEGGKFCYTEDEFYCTGGGLGGIYYILAKGGNKNFVKTLSLILNSKCFSKFCENKTFQFPKKGSAYNFGGAFMKNLDLPKECFDEKSDLYKQLLKQFDSKHPLSVNDQAEAIIESLYGAGKERKKMKAA